MVIVKIDMSMAKADQFTYSGKKFFVNMRNSIANTTAFDPAEINAVIAVGAPSYASGTHIWKGKKAYLKQTPASINKNKINATKMFTCPALTAFEIMDRSVVPNNP